MSLSILIQLCYAATVQVPKCHKPMRVDCIIIGNILDYECIVQQCGHGKILHSNSERVDRPRAEIIKVRTWLEQSGHNCKGIYYMVMLVVCPSNSSCV